MENIIPLSLQTLSSDEIDKIEEFRKSKQTAVLAILFSDIVNSTSATEKLGEQTYSKLRYIHNELFFRIMTRDEAGVIIKEIGDSFLCVFAEPSTSVLRAIEFQRAIHSNKEHLTVDGYTITVKIGIHLGQVAVEKSIAVDIFGRHVNQAARIESIARGGQILTSHSLYENAVGWLKDNRENNINWVSYGKTKLKGIEKAVDIYGFYAQELGSSKQPLVFKKQNQKKIIVVIVSLLILASLSFWGMQKFDKMKDQTQANSLKEGTRTYYVQFDFLELANNSSIDTIALQEKLLAQVILIFNPDSVATESDLIKYLSKDEKYYERNYGNILWSKTADGFAKYFQDTLNFDGTLLIAAKKIDYESRDSLQLETNICLFPERGGFSMTTSTADFALNNIEEDFRNEIQKTLQGLSQNSDEQGQVISFKDGIFLFRLSKGAKLRAGSPLALSRPYKGLDGKQQSLVDIANEISYFKNSIKDTQRVRKLSKLYSNIENDTLGIFTGGWNSPTGLRGRVIELYDSTGKASWQKDDKYIIDKPRTGDIIYLAY